MIESSINVDMEPEIIALLVRDPVIRQYLLAHPTLQARLIHYAAQISALDCAAVHQDLATYLDAEQLGTAEHVIYQRLVLHLHHCPLCFELYHDATGISAAQAAGVLPTWPQLPPAPQSVP